MFWVVAGMVAMMTATALPTAWGQTATTPSIKFLSPTSFAGEMPVVTDTTGSGGVDASYRLSAWTASAPQGALVDFELVPGDLTLTKPMTIGAGQPVAGDTFEYQWDIAEGPTGVSEGLHDLKATLYDANGEQLAADTIRVNFLHGTTEAQQDDNVPSLDITYPVSGGPMGQFTAPNGRTNSVIDAKTSKVSPAGYSVQAWFTTSPPGTAPVWRLCNAGEDDLSTGLPDGVRCTYPIDNPDTKEINEAVDPTRVTAVGLAGKKREDGTADVVRVMPYAQDPTSLTSVLLAKGTTGGPSTSNAPGTPVQSKDTDDAVRFPCSDWLRVKVTDQVGRSIAGANLDAHAQGPTDQLKFHNGILSANPKPVFQPPSEGHSFPEAADTCTQTHDQAAQQGEHGLGGQPDRKHIETTSGTRDNGLIDYALRTDQPGTTQLTVWVDKKDDDRFCTDEPSTAAAFGWGTDQAPAAHGEQPADCAVIPDPEPTEEPFDGSRSATIEPTATAVRSGRSTTVIGSIEAADDLCEAGQTLKLKSKKVTARRFRTIASATTDAFGLASFDVKVERTKVYRVVAPAAGECALAKSTIRKIRAI